MELKDNKRILYDLYTIYGRKDIDLIIEIATAHPNCAETLAQAYKMFGKSGLYILEQLGLNKWN
jgi:hypothetical protein